MSGLIPLSLVVGRWSLVADLQDHELTRQDQRRAAQLGSL